MIKHYQFFLLTILSLVISSCAFAQKKDDKLSDVIEILKVVREVHMSDTLTAAYKTSDAAFHLRNRQEEGFRFDDLHPFLADSVFFPSAIGGFWRNYITEQELWEVRANYFEVGVFKWDNQFDEIIPTFDVDPKHPQLNMKKRLSYPLFTSKGDKAVVFSEIVASVATIDFFVFHKDEEGEWEFVCRTIIGNRWGKK